MAAVGAFIIGDGVDRSRAPGPLGSAAAIAELLGCCGYAAIEVSEHEYESRFLDADHWLAWAWSHAERGTLERVPDADLLAACEAGKQAFQAARTANGDYAIRTRIRFTVAHTSG
jgi:hypothetical protein